MRSFPIKSTLPSKKATELSRNMYQITSQLPESRQIKQKLLDMDEQQQELYEIVLKNFQSVLLRKTGKQSLYLIAINQTVKNLMNFFFNKN